MLAEVRAGQLPREAEYSRWFCDESFDLIVWQRGAEIVAFQLCYDKQRGEAAVNYHEADGLAHYRVEDGDVDAMWHDATPLLRRLDSSPRAQVISEFLEDSAGIDRAVREFVVGKLREYSARS